MQVLKVNKRATQINLESHPSLSTTQLFCSNGFILFKTLYKIDTFIFGFYKTHQISTYSKDIKINTYIKFIP